MQLLDPFAPVSWSLSHIDRRPTLSFKFWGGLMLSLLTEPFSQPPLCSAKSLAPSLWWKRKEKPLFRKKVFTTMLPFTGGLCYYISRVCQRCLRFCSHRSSSLTQVPKNNTLTDFRRTASFLRCLARGGQCQSVEHTHTQNATSHRSLWTSCSLFYLSRSRPGGAAHRMWLWVIWVTQFGPRLNPPNNQLIPNM